MNKCFFSIIVILLLLGCNQRNETSYRNEKIDSDSFVETTENDTNNGGMLEPLQRDLAFYEDIRLNNGFVPFLPDRYALRNPHIDELLSLENIDSITLQIGVGSGGGWNPRWQNLPFHLDFSFFEEIPQLRHLVINTFGQRGVVVENLDWLRFLPNLESLVINKNDIVLDASIIGSLQNLVELGLYGENFVNVESAFELPNLRRLFLSSSESAIAFENISLPKMRNSNLEVLHICLPTIDFAYIGKLPRLWHLDVSSNNLINLEYLENQELEDLRISRFRRCGHIFDSIPEFDVKLNLERLSNLYQLKSLFIGGIDIHDVTPLLALPNLKSVHFFQSNVDIMPSIESESLREIIVDYSYSVTIQKDMFIERGIRVFSYEEVL